MGPAERKFLLRTKGLILMSNIRDVKALIIKKTNRKCSLVGAFLRKTLKLSQYFGENLDIENNHYYQDCSIPSGNQRVETNAAFPVF